MSRAPTSCRRPPSSRRRAFAAVLAVALVLVQMLGLAHRIVHVERTRLASATAIAAGDHASSALKSQAHRPGTSWLLALFAGHDPGADCDAFDHMSHADVAVDMTLDAAPLPVAAEACFRHAAWHVAAQAQGFLARGPPSAA